jgi:hypothetical protein
MPGQQTALAQPPKKRWALRFSLIFAAATVLLAFATYWLAKDDRQKRQDIQQLQAQLNTAQAKAAQDDATMRAYADVVGAPDTVSITLQQQAGGPPGQAHVLYNQRLGLALYSGQISPPPAGKIYQLWLVPASGAPVNAGLVAANQQNGAVVVHLEQGLPASAFAVTIEPEGGSPQATGPKVLIGALHS